MSQNEKSLSDLQQQILDLVRLRGWEGHTCDEVESLTGRTHQSASARLNELVEMTFLELRGTTRKTRAGRPARVYVVAGLRAARLRNPEPSDL